MCEAFAGEKNLKYIAAKPQDWVSKGYKPFGRGVNEGGQSPLLTKQ